MVEVEKNQDEFEPNNSQSEANPVTGTGGGSVKQLDLAGDTSGHQRTKNIELILDVPLEVTVELGRTTMMINDLIKLSQGSVIELTKAAGETLEIRVNQKLIARGETVVVNDKYGVRLTEVKSPVERVEGLR
jgi:flagellar motor switch protein FliN/FliY